MDILYRPLRMVGLIAPGDGGASNDHPATKDLAGYQSQYQQRQQQQGHQVSVEQRAADLARGVVYIPDIPPDLYEPARRLLDKYSGIRGQAHFEQHVLRIRDQLWEKHPQASIGHFRFLSLDFTSDPCYEIALVRLLADRKSDGSPSTTTFLDVGCGLGQVLRQLSLDGVDSARLYGCDLEPDFIEAGYELFGDRGRTRATFVTGDLVSAVIPGDVPSASRGRYANAWDAPEYRIDPTPHVNEAMDALDGKIDIIQASSLFHLFGWESQKKAAVRMVKLLRRDDPAVMIFGRHVGVSRPRNASAASTGSSQSTPGSTDGRRPASSSNNKNNNDIFSGIPNGGTFLLSSPPRSGSRGSSNRNSASSDGNGNTMQGGDKRFLHDARSWQSLWDEVGEATGTRWRTEVDWLGPPIQSMTDSSGAAVRRLRFAVFRS
ncbi:methyltransferase domain-containing protein [Microdochium nivale]|nr:methyltransferase domain-containing protein [Microdochium nivale]